MDGQTDIKHISYILNPSSPQYRQTCTHGRTYVQHIKCLCQCICGPVGETWKTVMLTWSGTKCASRVSNMSRHIRKKSVSHRLIKMVTWKTQSWCATSSGTYYTAHEQWIRNKWVWMSSGRVKKVYVQRTTGIYSYISHSWGLQKLFNKPLYLKLVDTVHEISRHPMTSHITFTYV